MAGEAEIVAGTTIARHGHAVLLRGRSGQGKSDLALRAICRPLRLPGEVHAEPFELVSDDQTMLRAAGNQVMAHAPETLRDQLEVRGIGIVNMPSTAGLPLALIVNLTAAPIERLPDYPGASEILLGGRFDVVEIAPFEASAPEKIALALARSVEGGRL